MRLSAATIRCVATHAAYSLLPWLPDFELTPSYQAVAVPARAFSSMVISVEEWIESGDCGITMQKSLAIPC